MGEAESENTERIQRQIKIEVYVGAQATFRIVWSVLVRLDMLYWGTAINAVNVWKRKVWHVPALRIYFKAWKCEGRRERNTGETRRKTVGVAATLCHECVGGGDTWVCDFGKKTFELLDSPSIILPVSVAK